MAGSVRLSQCMIVKNEEKNIRRALTWGKDIVSEQIVVDTGSTDRTVEIAKEMGAKVYEFPWIDDFAAAKNFAIDQATGDWIAFLDADEYLLPEDCQKVVKVLNTFHILEKKYEDNEIPHTLRCSWIHLDDKGNVMSASTQERIFRSLKGFRYKNRIHEHLVLESGQNHKYYDLRNEIKIYHDGYTDAAYSETNKLERNIRLLKQVLTEEPDNYEMLQYLGESLYASNRLDEAAVMFHKVLKEAGTSVGDIQKRNAYYALLKILTGKNQLEQFREIGEIYRQCEEENLLYPDIYYVMGMWNGRNRNWHKVADLLEAAIKGLEEDNSQTVLYILGEMEDVYHMLATAYQGLGRTPLAVKNCVKALRVNLFSEKTLLPLITMLKEDKNTTYEDLKGFLKKMYDWDQPKHRLFLYKCAKLLSYHQLAEDIFACFSEDELLCHEGEPADTDIPEEYARIDRKNKLDQRFIDVLEETRLATQQELSGRIQKRFQRMKQERESDYENTVRYFKTVKALDTQEEICVELNARGEVVQDHREDFLWLYEHLEDYRSKKALSGILENWIYFSTQLLKEAKDGSMECCDFDLIPSGSQETLVEVGAQTGESVKNYIHLYGEGYKKIVCYEAEEEKAKILERNLAGFRDITVRSCTVGAVDGEDRNRISIDQDMDEPITFLKMDIKHGLTEALWGAEAQIKANHPKLAVGIYHNYHDLWRIPRLIHEIDSTYRFYIRYYGGDLVPTKAFLIAL